MLEAANVLEFTASKNARNEIVLNPIFKFFGTVCSCNLIAIGFCRSFDYWFNMLDDEIILSERTIPILIRFLSFSHA